MNYVFKKSTLEKIEQEKSQCTQNAHTGNDAHSELETQYLQQKTSVLKSRHWKKSTQML